MNSRLPLYQQLADLLREKIETETIPFGQALPSERELSETYGINRMTVRRALNILVTEGLLIKIQGKGTFVNQPHIESAMDSIQGFGRFLKEQGIEPSSRVVYSGIRKAGYKFHRIFDISEDSPVFRLFRLRLGDGDPISLEDTYVPADLVPDIEDYDFHVYSLYDVMRQHGIFLKNGTEKLEIVRVTNPEAKLLDLAPGTMAFHLENISLDEHGRVVEFTSSYTKGERFRYSTVME